VNDPQKEALAKIGHPKHLDKLVHDNSGLIREAVARSGNDSHKDILMHDDLPDVRQS